MNIGKEVLTGIITITPMITIASQIDNSYVKVMRDAAPEEFVKLFELKPKKISIKINNGSVIVVNGSLSSFNVQIESLEELDVLKGFLTENSIKKNIIALLMNSFRIGIDSRQCKGDKQTCEINLGNNEYYAVVIDSSTDTVRLFLSQESYSQSGEAVDTVSPFNNNSAIINSPDLYVNYFNGESDMNINNKTLIGLPLGLIRSKLYSSVGNNQRNTDVTDFNYDVEFYKYRLIAGRSQDVDNYNSTSLLTFKTLEKDGVYLLTSRNLNVKKISSYQRLYFYMSKPGSVEVWNKNNIIYNAVVNAGQQYISYEDLPRGNYTVTVKLKEGDRIVNEIIQQVVNTSDFNLNTKDYDFQIGISRPHVSNVNSSTNIDAKIAYRPWDSLLFATGITASETEQMYSTGFKWLLDDDVTLSGGGALLTDSARYLTGSLSWKNLNFVWSQYQATDNNIKNELRSDSYARNTIQNIYFGNGDYQQLMLSGSSLVANGNIYFSVLYNTNKYNKFGGGKSIGYNAGYSTSWLWGTQVGMNITANNSNNYMKNGGVSSKYDSWNIALNFSLPLGERNSIHFSTTRDNKKNNLNDVTLQHYYTFNHNLNGSLSVGGANRDNEEYARLNSGLAFRNTALNANANISYQSISDNKVNVFGNVNSTQIITRDGLFFSNSFSDSYLVMSDETRKKNLENFSEKPSAQLSIDSGNNSFSMVDYYSGNGGEVIPLNSYRKYSVKLNTSAFGTYNAKDDQVHGFSLPGSVLSMKTDFKTEYQIIGAFYDSKGAALEQLECFGTSCVSIEKMNSGLFKILLKGSDDFRLNADGQTCLSYNEINGLNQKLTRLTRVDCRSVINDYGPLMLAEKTDFPSRSLGLRENTTSGYYIIKDTKQSHETLMKSQAESNVKQKIISLEKDNAWRFGVFKNKKNAVKTEQKLRDVGIKSRIIMSKKGFYEVYGRVSLFPTVEQEVLIQSYSALKIVSESGRKTVGTI
ncbi:TPA: TcfC E-set like domain-containing protein [Salmonella enterica subsp. houtenae]|nr:TcfC E-set like domain-containing protein [Salmonella enterica subsp. houtenae]